MRVLVTRGAGFLGSSLVEALVESGHDVLVLDNCWRGRRENLKAVADIVFIEDDACQASSYERIQDSDSIDIVYHLNNQRNKMVSRRGENGDGCQFEFDISIASICGQHNARYVFTSSPEAYGESEIMPLGGDESSVFSASSQHQRHAVYGASKYLGEVAVHHAHRHVSMLESSVH